MKPTDIVDWQLFSQFGLAGLTLGVFFCILIFVLYLNNRTVKGIVNRMSEDHKSVVRQMSEDHKEANEAWRMTFSSHSDRSDVRQQETNVVLRDLTKVIAENNVHTERNRNVR